jgi:hypothetical protein
MYVSWSGFWQVCNASPAAMGGTCGSIELMGWVHTGIGLNGMSIRWMVGCLWSILVIWLCI